MNSLRSATLEILYTSLPPAIRRPVSSTDFGSVYQRACIESWRRAGFTIISINTAEEIKALGALNYPVEFAVTHRSRPSIADFLQHIRESGQTIAGIVNADCFLFDLPNVLRTVLTKAEDGMALVERLNIDPSTLRPSGELCYGFDAFFFATGAAQNIWIDDELCIGQPWWDYWLPAAFAAAGAKLVSIEAPLLAHLDHDRNWQKEPWLENGRRMLGWLLAADRSLPKEFEALVRDFRGKDVFTEQDISHFAQKCFNWLQSCAEKPPLAEKGEWEDLVLGLLRGAGGLPERRLRKEISELTLYLAEARGKIFRLESDRKIHLGLLATSRANVSALENELRAAQTELQTVRIENDKMRRFFPWKAWQPPQKLFAALRRIGSKKA